MAAGTYVSLSELVDLECVSALSGLEPHTSCHAVHRLAAGHACA